MTKELETVKLLRQLMREHPKATQAQLQSMYFDEIKSGLDPAEPVPDLLMAALRQSFPSLLAEARKAARAARPIKPDQSKGKF